MASLADAEEALHSTRAKANFQRLTRLLMCGGLRLLRETFDSIHSPADLPLRLSDAAIKTQLRGARLTKPEWDCLYPSAGVYGKSTDFDITLTFRLLRTICNLKPPPGPRGWDVLPKSSDHSLEADLVRIKYYRNEVYGHSKTLEITDTEFNDLWGKISEALMRIATRRSPEKKDEWKKSIDGFLRNALTPGEERYIEELNTWYKQDMDVKSEVEKLKEEFKIQMGDLKEEVAKQSQRPVTVIVNVVVNIAESIKRTGSSGRPQIPHESGESQGICAIPVLDQEEMEGTSDSGKQLATPTEIRIWTVILSFKRSVELVFQYLRYTLKAFVRKHDVGSLLITVECSSLQILEGLWEDYSSGHLNAIAQEILVTAEVLEKLGLDDVRLKTFISEEEYQKGKQIFMDHSVSGQSRLPPGEVAGKSASLVEAEKDTVSEFVPGDVPGERITPIEEGKDIGDDSGQDYLERISDLEKENRELTRRLNAELQGISNLKKENRELTRRLNAVENELQGKESGKIQQLEKKNLQLEIRLDLSKKARERSYLELQELKDKVVDLEEDLSDRGFLYPPYRSRWRAERMLGSVSAISGQSRLPPGEVAGKSASLVEAEKDTVSEFVPGDVPGELITPIEKGKDIGDDSGQGKESGKIQQLQKKNIQLEKRLNASEDARERSYLELQILKDKVVYLEEYVSDLDFPYPSYGSRRRAERMLGSVSGLPLKGIKGFCQVVVNRQKLEALDGEKVEFERVFKDLGFDVDEKVCKSNDDVKRVIVSVADRDYSDYNRFVCFIQSNVNRDWEIEGFDGGSLSVAKLLTNFRYSRFSSWSEPLKIFIIQGHQTTTALEADEPIDEKSFSLKLPFGENCLCLFVPYRKGYISTLLSVIKSQGSKPRDIFDILSEAKKLFYEKNHITIPDPVHNFRGPVYLNQEI